MPRQRALASDHRPFDTQVLVQLQRRRELPVGLRFDADDADVGLFEQLDKLLARAMLDAHVACGWQRILVPLRVPFRGPGADHEFDLRQVVECAYQRMHPIVLAEAAHVQQPQASARAPRRHAVGATGGQRGEAVLLDPRHVPSHGHRRKVQTFQ